MGAALIGSFFIGIVLGRLMPFWIGLPVAIILAAVWSHFCLEAGMP